MYQVNGCVVVRRGDVERAFETPIVQGKCSLEPLESIARETGYPKKILCISHVKNPAEVHRGEGDQWEHVSGDDVIFIVGGRLVEPKYRKKSDGVTDDLCELFADEIEGGVATILKQGDSIWIPRRVPHQHMCIDGTAFLSIIKK